MKNIFGPKKIVKFELLFTKPKSGLAVLWSPTTPKFARVGKSNFQELIFSTLILI